MDKVLHSCLRLGATNWKKIACSSPNQNEGKEGKDDTHPLALPVKNILSCLMHVIYAHGGIINVLLTLLLLKLAGV